MCTRALLLPSTSISSAIYPRATSSLHRSPPPPPFPAPSAAASPPSPPPLAPPPPPQQPWTPSRRGA
uniref:Uncharacterized protein n=1 Tax=Arundo donax TaxID=35708 RepID=A0A0A9G389_ARUDO